MQDNSIKTEAEKAFILRNQARINILLTTGLAPVLAEALVGVEARHLSPIQVGGKDSCKKHTLCQISLPFFQIQMSGMAPRAQVCGLG